MPVKNSINAIPLSEVGSAALNNVTFTPINPRGLPHPCFLIRITNDTDQLVVISYDGVTDHDVIQNGAGDVPGQAIEINGQTNAQPTTNIANFAKGTIIYARSVTGTGGLYLTGYYQAQGA